MPSFQQKDVQIHPAWLIHYETGTISRKSTNIINKSEVNEVFLKSGIFNFVT